MRSQDIEEFGLALARARRAAQPSPINLRTIGSMHDARAVQDVAVATFKGPVCGYTLTATSALTRRLLRCLSPVYGLLFDENFIDNGMSFRLPYSMLGIGGQFLFVLGSPLQQPATMQTVGDAIVSCNVGLQLLGRRMPNSVPLNDWSATADFALDVATVRGPRIDGWKDVDLAATEVSLRLGDNVVASGKGMDVFGHPVSAVVWLANELGRQGIPLQAGDIVATGSCTGLAQVAPGQHVRAAFDRLGDVELRLE